MRLKKIKLQNFLSYERLDFSFHDKENEDPSIYIITGVNNDTEASVDNSNGSGKSTLVGEAISFNLFGKNLRGTSKKVKLENAIKFGESTLINDGEYFIDNGNILKIHREKERDGKNSLDIKVDGESKSKRLKRLSENDIRDFLGIDPEVYYQTISYYKDNISLLAMNYSQRLDFFKKLVNLDIMDEYYKNCKKYLSEIDEKLSAADTKKKAQLAIIEAISSNDTKYQQIIKESIDNLKSEISEVESIEIKDITEFNDKLEKIKAIMDKLDSQIREFENKNRIDKVKIKELNQEIKNFSNLKNTKCPTCEQEVSGEYADSIIKAKNDLISNLTDQIKEREEQIEELAKKSLSVTDKKEKIEKEIEKIKSEETVKRIKLQTLNKQLKEKMNELDKVLKAIRTEDDTNEYQENIKKLEKAEKILNKRRDMTEFWADNLAPKSSVRSAIIRKHINYLSDIFEYYLGKLFRNTIIGKMEIDDEGNIDIILKTDGHEVNYWNLSSGERKRTELALLFSLYIYMLNMLTNAPKFLIVDEPMDALDQSGIEYVTETLFDIYKTYKIDIFIISHVEFPLEKFEGSVIKRILVTKSNGCSTASYI